MSKRPEQATERGVRAAERALGLRDAGSERIEYWAWGAFALLAVLVGFFVYLGTRPGGSGPVWVFAFGRYHLVLAALGLLLIGLLRSFAQRPLLRRRRGRAFVALVLVIGVAPFPFPYPTSREIDTSAVRFRLPVEGEWVVVHGGKGAAESLLSVTTHDRRFGVVLVRTVDGATSPPGATRPGEYYAFGQPVLAAAGGTVVRVREDVPDHVDGLSGPAPDRDQPPHGNLVVLEVGEDEYLFTTHLRAGSIRAAVGDLVHAGDVLGEVGFSGQYPLLPQPQVAVHLQSTPEDLWGEAVPWLFRDYVADGREVSAGVPRGGYSGGPSGQRVRALESGSD